MLSAAMVSDLGAIGLRPFYDAATTATIKSWSDPFHFVVYLFVLFVGMIVYYQWKWSRETSTMVLLLIVRADGHGDYRVVPQEGGRVSLTNPNTKVTRLWPINELTTVTVPYPGVAFIPEFLQKEIRMIGVTEEDWEPFTNRSPHRKNIVSPDVLEKLKLMVDSIQTAEVSSDPAAQAGAERDKQKLSMLEELVTELTANASTGPTRELIASPAVLGNLMHERITEAVTALGSSIMSKIEDVVKQLTRLGKPISAIVVYIGLGLTVILLVVTLFITLPLKNDMLKVKTALGIVDNAVTQVDTAPTATK